MKKLLLLTLISAYGASMYAMESSSEGARSSSTEEIAVPVTTKSDRPARTRKLLERKKHELSSSLRETEKKYYEIDKEARLAYGPSVNKDNPDQAQAKAIYDGYKKERFSTLAELKKLEEQMHTIKYEWFMNRIKHSRSIALQDAIQLATGKYNRPPEVWHLNYCLFTREQKMKLIAYAQTIQANRNAQLYLAKGDEKFEEKKPDPKIFKKYNDACYVTLLMQEFKNMTVADQQKGYRYFEYQTNP
jgi:hypothetical protein